MALDSLGESGQAGASRELALPRPLGKGKGAGGNTSSQGDWASRSTIADEQGMEMDRGGELGGTQVDESARGGKLGRASRGQFVFLWGAPAD